MARTPALREDKKQRQRDAESEAMAREVDEAVRKETLGEFAARYGKIILAALVLFFVALAIFLFWRSSTEAAMEAESETLVSALDQIEAGNLEVGEARLAELQEDGGPGPRASARMLAAAIALQDGRAEDAARDFASVADDSDVPEPLRDLARVREMTVRFDSVEPRVVIERLSSLAVPGNPLFGSAGELVAMAHLEAGDEEAAGELFAAIAKDEDQPVSLRSRTRQMAGLLGVDAIDDVEALLASEGGAPPDR